MSFYINFASVIDEDWTLTATVEAVPNVGDSITIEQWDDGKEEIFVVKHVNRRFQPSMKDINGKLATVSPWFITVYLFPDSFAIKNHLYNS